MSQLFQVLAWSPVKGDWPTFLPLNLCLNLNRKRLESSQWEKDVNESRPFLAPTSNADSQSLNNTLERASFRGLDLWNWNTVGRVLTAHAEGRVPTTA